MKRLFFRHRPLFMALLTGMFLALSWPARGIPVLSFVALIPLFWVEDYFFHRGKHSRPVNMFLHAWMAFFVFNLLTTWWIMHASFPGMLVAVILNPVFMALPWLAMHLTRRILPGRQGQLSLVFYWLSFEYLHALWDLNWNWLDLGNVFATVPALVQWYEFTGVAGGSAWVLIANMLLYILLKQHWAFLSPAIEMVSFSGKRKGFHIVLTALVLVSPVIVSQVLWQRYREDPNPVGVVVVQPSHDPYSRVDYLDEAEQRIRYMIELAGSRLASGTRFVVAPEAANPVGIWHHSVEENLAVQLLRDHIDRHPGLVWVLGSITYKRYGPADARPPSAMPYQPGGYYYDVFNSAVMLEAGEPVAYHHKSKLVPGIERMPFYRVLKPLGWLVELFGGTQSSMGTQDHRGIFMTSGGHGLAPAVCYESIYGQYMAEYIRSGAGLIFIVTNDGWWRETPGHRQHHHYARLRAIESRRSIARSASTGISSFINQRGEVLKQTGWWEATAISHELNQNYKLTFFTINGNYPGKLSLFITALLLAYVVSQRLIRRGQA